MERNGKDGRYESAEAKKEKVNDPWESMFQELDTAVQLFDTSFDTSKLFGGSPDELHLTKENTCYVMSNRFENRPVGKGNLKVQYEFDERNIDRTFSLVNFTVKKKSNLTVHNMKTFIKDICRKDYSGQQCLVLFILSHGDEKGMIQGDDGNFLEIDWILDNLQGVETLNGKPKLIFVQVCRGAEDMEIVEVKEKGGMQAADARVKKAKKADTFVYYATMEGNVAFTNTSFGSFFIFALCKIMLQFYDATTKPRYHLGDVVTKVNDFLSTWVQKFKVREERAKDHVQVSEACSSLTQNIYFYPKYTQI